MHYNCGMSRFLAALAFALVASLLALDGVAVRAETIYLKGGSKLTGRIVEQSDDWVKLEVAVEGGGSAVISLKRSRIERIEKADSLDERIEAAQRRLDMRMDLEAERDFRELVRENPRHAGARAGLARALYNQGKLAEALKTLDHYLLLVPQGRDPQLMLLAAEYRMYAGEYAEAKNLAREAAALEPQNSALREQAAALTRRVDRYRDGTEAAEQKAAQQKAEAEKRASERAGFDRTVGSNMDACEAAADLLYWMREANQNLPVAARVELRADARAEAAYARGGDAVEFQRAVDLVTVTITVNEAQWLRDYDHIKRQVVYGLYYQLKTRYPKATPAVTVVKREPDDKGRAGQVDLARGTWDGKRAKLVVELWTPANVDRQRQAGLKSGKR